MNAKQLTGTVTFKNEAGLRRVLLYIPTQVAAVLTTSLLFCLGACTQEHSSRMGQISRFITATLLMSLCLLLSPLFIACLLVFRIFEKEQTS